MALRVGTKSRVAFQRPIIVVSTLHHTTFIENAFSIKSSHTSLFVGDSAGVMPVCHCPFFSISKSFTKRVICQRMRI